jgi:tetratricopeptide (TPR) repeat protein
MKDFKIIQKEAKLQYELALHNQNRAEYEKAIKLFQFILDIEPNDLDAIYNTGVCYYRLWVLEGEDAEFKEGIDLFHQYILLEPKKPAAYTSIIRMYYFYGEAHKDVTAFDLSIKKCEESLSLFPNFDALYNDYANTLYQLLHFKRDEELLSKLLEIGTQCVMRLKSCYPLAYYYALHKDKTNTLIHLKECYKNNDIEPAWIKMDEQEFHFLKKDATFKRLLSKGIMDSEVYVSQMKKKTSVKSIDEGMDCADDITKLDLGKQNLYHLSSDIVVFSNLETLILDGNDCLRELPEEIEYLEKLESVSLKKNSSEILRSMKRIQNLRKVDLSGMDLRYTSSNLEYLAGCKTVKELIMKKCGLTSLPNAFSSFVNLEILNLDDNSLKEIPQLYFLTNLKKLSIKANYRLVFCPKEIIMLPKLKELYVKGLHIDPSRAEEQKFLFEEKKRICPDFKTDFWEL